MKTSKNQVKIERPEKEQIDREEAIKRMKEFGKRKEKMIAAIRKDTN